MMYKKIQLFSAFMLLVFSLGAQDIESAYKLLSYGKAEEAVATATKIVSADPANMANQFSLYSLMNAAGQYNEAKKVLEGIKTADASGAYGKTAEVLMRLDAGANPDDLTADIDKAIRKGKKMKGFLYRTVGEYFLFSEKKNPVKAIANIKVAIDEHSLNNASTRMILGDAYSAKNDAGNAVTNYEYAMELDKTSAVPHYKIGTTYIRAKNYEFGVPELRKAIETDPNYMLAYKDLGKYYYDAGKYAEAKENYGKYIASTKPTLVENIQYANILYFAKDFDNGIKVMNEVKAADKEVKYLGINRLLGFSYYEKGKYDQAEQILTDFISNHDTLKLLADDYIYLAKTQEKLEGDSVALAKYDSLSILNYMMAFGIDSTKEGVLKEKADTLFNHKKYDDAGLLYFARSKYTNLAADYFYATRADYLGGDYVRGIQAAEGIINKLPEDMTGYLWKARHSALLDTINKGELAVPSYLKIIELGGLFNKNKETYKIKVKNESGTTESEVEITKIDNEIQKNNMAMLEPLNWLTVYYINIKKDYVKAQEFNDKALEIDPANEQVMKLFTFLTAATKPKK